MPNDEKPTVDEFFDYDQMPKPTAHGTKKRRNDHLDETMISSERR